MYGDVVHPSKQHCWSSKTLQIPPSAPSRLDGCTLIDVKYELEVNTIKLCLYNLEKGPIMFKIYGQRISTLCRHTACIVCSVIFIVELIVHNVLLVSLSALCKIDSSH